MNPFGFDRESMAERIRASCRPPTVPTLAESVWGGSAGFGAASLVVYATVAFGGRGMYRSLGEAGAYAVWALLFVALGGAALARLVIGPGLRRFLALFAASFSLYAVAWVAIYFVLRRSSELGAEGAASVVAPALIAVTFAWAFESRRELPRICFWLIAGHLAGYFAGRVCHDALGGRTGMILWGACYGIGFGAALGYALHECQSGVRAWLRQEPVPEEADGP